MKILTHKDLILGFIKQNLENKQHQKQVRQILDNENSVFLYSQKFFAFIKESIEPDELDTFQNLLKQFSDYGQNIKSLSTSQTFNEEFLHIFSTTQDKVVISISCNKPNQEIQTQIPNIAVLSQQRKPNYHWLVVSLAILHPNPILVRNYDFENDKEVDEFFFDIFSIPKSIRFVSIFDDACNFQHNKFAFLSKKKVSVLYYTVKLNITDSKQRFDNLKKSFSVKMFAKPKGGHEREINFEGIIIIPTNDFWMLNITDGKKWSISVLYNEIEAQKSLDYKDKYVRFLENRWLD